MQHKTILDVVEDWELLQKVYLHVLHDNFARQGSKMKLCRRRQSGKKRKWTPLELAHG
jgi:hypothetical protein